jgi:hypothetical protein
MMMASYANKLEKAIHSCNDSDLYDIWAVISAVYAMDIQQIDSLFEEIKQYSGLLLRNSKALHGCLIRYISENYNPVEKELISDIEQLLTKYPSALAQYQSALAKYERVEFARNILDDIRLSFELLVQAVLENKKSLENNVSALGTFLKDKNTSHEVINMFIILIDYMNKYQNNHVKHNDAVPKEELRYILELTSVMIKFLLQISLSIKETVYKKNEISNA